MAAKATVARSVRLTPEADEKLRYIAAKEDISVNALIQQMIDDISIDNYQVADLLRNVFDRWEASNSKTLEEFATTNFGIRRERANE